jgi:hypothetical protein
MELHTIGIDLGKTVFHLVVDQGYFRLGYFRLDNTRIRYTVVRRANYAFTSFRSSELRQSI